MNYKFDGDKVFFTSDTHFNHTNIIQYCQRPFKSTDEMNEAMIDNWNSVVGEDDTVFHLGDFSLEVQKSGIRFLIDSTAEFI